jgi:hypothetical protein
VRVLANGTARQPAPGIWVRGDGGPVVATIRGSTITDNTDAGVRVAQGEARTELELVGNVVSANNRAARRPVGGISFETPSTLVRFSGNRIFGNAGDQLGFAAPPNDGVWRLGGDCSAEVNQIYCYGAGAVAVRLASPVATEVDARGLSWQSPDPTAGRDFLIMPATTGANLLHALPSCAPVAAPMCP